MNGDDLQARMALEDPTQDDVGQRHSSLERVPHDVDHVVARQPLATREAVRMENDDDVQLLDSAPERLVGRLVVVVSFCARVD